MTRLRRVVLWATLIGVGALTALSVVGAFMGDGPAGEMFNSWPMVVFWVVWAVVFVAGLVIFKRLRRSPGLLAVHAGGVLVLVGSMVGSDGGHRVADRVRGHRKVPSGRMQIMEGSSSNRVVAFGGSEEVGRLPFSIALTDFSIEHYPAEETRWLLLAEAPPMTQGGETVERPPRRIAWSVGKEAEVPYTEARVEVVRYLAGARATYAQDVEPALVVTHADGTTTRVPAEVGQEVVLSDPEVTLRIVQVFGHLRVEGRGESRRIYDVPGESDNPALKIAQVLADGTVKHSYVMPGFPAHRQEKGRVNLEYVTTGEPTGAKADPESRFPAMEVLLRHGDKEERQWLMVRRGASYASLALGEFLGETGEQGASASQPGGGHEHGHSHVTETTLYLVEPTGQIRDYKSELVVLEEGQEVAHKTIEVNDPLHYGGYHFYQHSYDSEQGRYTVLSVQSDSGLWAVYVGLFLLGAGVMWLFWVQPAARYLRGRRDDGD